MDDLPRQHAARCTDDLPCMVHLCGCRAKLSAYSTAWESACMLGHVVYGMYVCMCMVLECRRIGI